MPWERKWNGCIEYSRWTNDGITWTVEDVNPDEDEAIAELMIKYFLPEAPMAMRLDLHKDETSSNFVKNFWVKCLSQRSSLVCYCHARDQKEIAAVNICPVNCVDDPVIDCSKLEPNGGGVTTLVQTLQYIDNKADVFKTLNVDRYLSGTGLFVMPKYRGNSLGAKVLDAREPMCKLLGIPATATLFTGPASQILATRCGFKNHFDITFEQLSDRGFHYPGDPTKVLKMMYKKY